MSPYKLGDTEQGPLLCDNCGLIRPQLTVVAFGPTGRTIWTCQQCATAQAVAVAESPTVAVAVAGKAKAGLDKPAKAVVDSKSGQKAGKSAAKSSTVGGKTMATARKAVQDKAPVLTSTFVLDKETSNAQRFSAKNSESVFGSLYVAKEEVPAGAKAVQVQVTFTY